MFPAKLNQTHDELDAVAASPPSFMIEQLGEIMKDRKNYAIIIIAACGLIFTMHKMMIISIFYVCVLLSGSCFVFREI